MVTLLKVDFSELKESGHDAEALNHKLRQQIVKLIDENRPRLL